MKKHRQTPSSFFWPHPRANLRDSPPATTTRPRTTALNTTGAARSVRSRSRRIRRRLQPGPRQRHASHRHHRPELYQRRLRRRRAGCQLRTRGFASAKIPRPHSRNIRSPIALAMAISGRPAIGAMLHKAITGSPARGRVHPGGLFVDSGLLGIYWRPLPLPLRLLGTARWLLRRH